MAGLALLAIAQALHGETTLDLSVDASVSGAGWAPSLAWGMSTDAQRIGDLGPSLYFGLSAVASRNILDTGYSGSADMVLSAQTLNGSTNVGLKLEAVGALPSAAEAGSAVAALSLPVTFNGPALSLSVAPMLSVDPLDSGYGSVGLESGVSFMAGDFVLKPGLGFAVIRPWIGGLEYALKPGMEISWYPSFPLSIAMSGEYRASVSALTEGSWGFDCVGVAAPAPRILLTLKAEAFFDQSSKDVTLLFESAFSLAKDGSGGEWSVPVQTGYVLVDDRQSFSVGLGLRYAF
jgi:hypothetical protein